MTDEKYTFVTDISERKRVARGAAARKCGSKSKKCTLPSDSLTAAELKRRNGKMVSYNLTRPMEWNEFKSISKAGQEEYLRGLINTYGVGAKDICKMFDISNSTLWRHMQSALPGKNLFAYNRPRPTKQATADWNAFLDGNPLSTMCVLPATEEKEHEEVIHPAKATSGTSKKGRFLIGYLRYLAMESIR